MAFYKPAPSFFFFFCGSVSELLSSELDPDFLRFSKQLSYIQVYDIRQDNDYMKETTKTFTNKLRGFCFFFVSSSSLLSSELDASFFTFGFLPI